MKGEGLAADEVVEKLTPIVRERHADWDNPEWIDFAIRCFYERSRRVAPCVRRAQRSVGATVDLEPEHVEAVVVADDVVEEAAVQDRVQVAIGVRDAGLVDQRRA